MTYLELLREPEEHPDRSVHAAAGRVRAWWRAHRGRFSVIFAESITAHVLLFSLLILAQSSSLALKNESAPLNERAIKQALAELASDKAAPGNAETPSEAAENSESEAIRAVDRLFKFDERLNDKDKVEIIKKMIQSFLELQAGRGGTFVDLSALSLDEIRELLAEGKTIRLGSGDKAFLDEGASADEGLEIYKLDRSDESQLGRLRKYEGEMRQGVRQTDEYVTVPSEYSSRGGTRSIPKEFFFRECPYEQILARGASLFTAAKGFPSLGPASLLGPGDHPAGEDRKALKDREARTFSGSEMTLFIIRKAPPPSRSAAKQTSLLLAEDETRHLLDDLMALSDIEQLALFQRDYLDRFDADDEGLARFASEFVYTNLNSVFYTISDFSMAFDGLEELFYKRSIYDFYATYWRRHPRTRTAAEFLFCLAGAYDFEKRVIAYLDRVAAEADDIRGNRVGKNNVFNPKAKAFVIAETIDALSAGLRERGIPSIEAAIDRYTKEEIAIYDALAELGGEIRNRALFAKGQVFWEEGAPAPAFEIWRKIDDPAFDNQTFLKIRPLLSRRDAAIAGAVPTVTQALTEGSGLGARQMLARQYKFHKWKNRERLLR